ncbi:hypothetical protein F5Y17DRAFT_430399 [Xylariaceae sp. FL0594]|nr:hypothetical protein F5Y17DRAFT_430399 [Xylariaceae sp. FL0594]
MKLFTSGLLLASIANASSEALNSTIVGCVEVGCPPSSSVKAEDNCTVTDNSYSYIGLTSLDTAHDNLKGLTWTKAVKAIDSGGKSITFKSSFLLGTPPNLDLSNTTACSLFFHGISPSLSFHNNTPDLELAQGTCSDALGADCAKSLLDQARGFLDRSRDNITSSEELCSALRENLTKNMTEACWPVSKFPWSDVDAIALTGGGSPKPIKSEENSTSTCWPVLPKQNELTHVSDYTLPTSSQGTEAGRGLFYITPILTLFHSKEGLTVTRWGSPRPSTTLRGQPTLPTTVVITSLRRVGSRRPRRACTRANTKRRPPRTPKMN